MIYFHFSKCTQQMYKYFYFYGFFYLYSFLFQMNQVQKFNKLRKILSQDQSIKKILQNATNVANKYLNLGVKSFVSGQDLVGLAEDLNRLSVPQINEILHDLKEPHAIVAFPIHKAYNFTLFFVIVPPQKKFDWHSHPKMVGVSKCFHGHLQISTLDILQMQALSYNTYLYPKNKMQFQSMKKHDERTVSVIQPQNYNVHKIEAIELSAFFDLLLPDYPDNNCQFYKSINEDSQHILLQQTEGEEQQIVGWDVYLDQLIKNEKRILKNYILK